MSKVAACLSICIVFSLSSIAQDTKELQDTFFEAEYFFLNEEYYDAINYYLQLYEKLPDNANLAYRIGVCYLNIKEKKDLSIEYLEKASNKLSSKYKEGSVNQNAAPYNALYYLGKSYQINYKFDEAKDAFKKYLETILPIDKENYDFVIHEIEVCNTAKSLINKPVKFIEENVGELFNDEKDNYNPLISADGKTFAFMVALKFYNAIMFSRLIDGNWSAPTNISPDLQIDGDIFISCLSANGNLLFLSKDDNYNSDLYVSSFNGNSWSKALPLNKNINTKYWESHGFISEDGSQLIFASDRPGGYGGLDLYVSQKVNGDWGPAVNLGPEINTRFNEDRPFLINNSKTIFFSSQGHKNIGGYDIFRSDLQSDSKWSTPKNIGYPINNTDDNIFFMPIGNGNAGYYSRTKETGGFGKEDIYKVTLK